MLDSPDLIRTTQAILDDLATATADELVAMWDELGSWDEADVARLVAGAEDLVRSSAEVASSSTAALLASMAEISPSGLDTAAIASTAVEGLRGPFTATWKALANGRPWDEAITVGRNAMRAHGRDVVHRSSRAATAQVADTVTLGDVWKPSKYQQRPTAYERKNWDRPAWPRFERVATAKSCDWCLFFTTQTYYSAESASFGHTGCDCGVLPVSDATAELNKSHRDAAGYDEKKVIGELNARSKRLAANRR